MNDYKRKRKLNVVLEDKMINIYKNDELLKEGDKYSE